MLFSIIVPVYKVESYIKRCVQSLLNQTFHDVEIILVDDGSPDQCPMMCDEFAKEDARIKVIHKKNGGLSDARNVGIEAATGEYIIFVDSDDFISPSACEELSHYAHNSYDILIAAAVVEGAKLDLSHISAQQGAMSGPAYLKRAFSEQKAAMAAWLNIYKRDFLNNYNIRFKCGILHEDEEFTPRALLKAKSVIVTGVSFYHYIVREDSITTQKDKRKNLMDFYSTCCELEPVFRAVEDIELRDCLLDSLARKYMSLYYSSNAFRYGKSYYHRGLVLRNAKKARTRCKATLYCISPRIYCWINKRTKR